MGKTWVLTCVARVTCLVYIISALCYLSNMVHESRFCLRNAGRSTEHISATTAGTTTHTASWYDASVHAALHATTSRHDATTG